MREYLFTSESVTEGHPDKVCDQISDAILDEYLKIDPYSRVACEVGVTTNMVFIMGEITSKGIVDIEKVTRDTIREIGYDSDEYMFNAETCKIIINIDKQSKDIAQGVDNAIESKGKDTKLIGAGDQGIMFGYACDDTKEYMPLSISLAHKLAKRLSEVRKMGTISYLRPDGKVQVTIKYEDNEPLRVDTIVISTQHDPDISQDKIEHDMVEYVIKQVVPERLLDISTKVLINPTGNFVIGGPAGDAGLTGRKIIVDTYGGYARHGGGAFSGKDPTKVDRSAAYMARYIAKNIVASNYAKKCEVQIAYAIGKAEPVSVYVNTFNTNKISEEEILEKINTYYDLTPNGIIEKLSLRSPIYKKVAAYGHFGRDDLNLPWEKIERI